MLNQSLAAEIASLEEAYLNHLSRERELDRLEKAFNSITDQLTEMINRMKHSPLKPTENGN